MRLTVEFPAGAKSADALFQNREGFEARISYYVIDICEGR